MRVAQDVSRSSSFLRMADTRYAYSTTPTRNPFRLLLALWRTVRNPTDTTEVAIVEMGFARSRIGRRFARWEEVLDALRKDPRTAPALRDRQPCQPIDLDALGRLPERTLGRVFASHCRARALNPNLGYIAPETEADWLLDHLLQTHDLWHVATGWGNDELGEYGLGGFYLAQVAAPPFFGFLLALAALSTILRRRPFGEFIEAVVAGYEMGKRAEPLFGRDWATLWAEPLVDVRARLGITDERVIGEGIRTAA
jgi:ubiquinone biosynthesis protein COQ4